MSKNALQREHEDQVLNSIQDYFSEIDKLKQPISEMSVGDRLRELVKEQDSLSEKAQFVLRCETTAFYFNLLQEEQSSPWKTDFGPLWCGVREDGTEECIPDARALDSAVLEYWKERFGCVQHPVLRARYADLLWDLTRLVTDTNPDVKHAIGAIDAYLEAVDKKLFHHMVVGIRYSERALELAIRLSKENLITSAKRSMFVLCSEISTPEKGGSWPFLFDNLYGNKGAKVTSEEMEKIVNLLEGLLVRYSNVENKNEFNPHHAKEAGERLAKYYRKKGLVGEVRRVTRIWCGAFERISQEAKGMLATEWLLEVQEAYSVVGLKDDVQRVQLLTEKKGSSIKSEMRKVSIPLQINLRDVDLLCSELTEGSFNDALKHIASAFIPSSKSARATLEKIKKDSVLYSLIPIQIYSDGRSVGRVGSIDDDLEGRLLIQVRQDMEIQSIFLEGCIDKLRGKSDFSLESILNFVFESPIFTSNAQNLLREGVSAWLDSDHTKAIHVIVPQIESTLRQILVVMHLPTTKLKRDHVVLKNLSDILSEPAVEQALGESIVRYFKALFSDRRGVNLRNLIAHGAWSSKDLNRQISDRVIHVLLVLGLIRVAPVEESK